MVELERKFPNLTYILDEWEEYVYCLHELESKPVYMAPWVWTRFSKWQGLSTETALVEVGDESTLLWQLVSCPSSQWGIWDNSIHTVCRSKFQLADIFFDFSLPGEADRGPQGTGRIAVTVLSAGWSHSETKGCTTIMLKVSNLSPAVVSSHCPQPYWSTFGPLQEQKLCAVCCAVIVAPPLLLLHKAYWARPQYGLHLTTATAWNEFCL